MILPHERRRICFYTYVRHADHALRIMKERLRTGHALDFQDLVSRFTLDSATEFFFGHDVGTLSAGLPYPPSSDLAKLTAHARTSGGDVFAGAFLAGQEATAERTFRGHLWALFEPWEDEVGRHMEVVNGFVDPIVKRALDEKRERERQGKQDPEKGTSEDSEDTLLAHLVAQSDGEPHNKYG